MLATSGVQLCISGEDPAAHDTARELNASDNEGDHSQWDIFNEGCDSAEEEDTPEASSDSVARDYLIDLWPFSRPVRFEAFTYRIVCVPIFSYCLALKQHLFFRARGGFRSASLSSVVVRLLRKAGSRCFAPPWLDAPGCFDIFRASSPNLGW